MSQVEFGEKCGFYQTYLSRVENGKANPTLNAIEVIANAFGLSVFELFDKVKERMPRVAAKADTGPGSLYRAPSHKTQKSKRPPRKMA